MLLLFNLQKTNRSIFTTEIWRLTSRTTGEKMIILRVFHCHLDANSMNSIYVGWIALCERWRGWNSKVHSPSTEKPILWNPSSLNLIQIDGNWSWTLHSSLRCSEHSRCKGFFFLNLVKRPFLKDIFPEKQCLNGEFDAVCVRHLSSHCEHDRSRWWFQIVLYLHSLGKWSNLTRIFFKWVETTN